MNILDLEVMKGFTRMCNDGLLHLTYRMDK